MMIAAAALAHSPFAWFLLGLFILIVTLAGIAERR